MVFFFRKCVVFNESTPSLNNQIVFILFRDLLCLPQKKATLEKKTPRKDKNFEGVQNTPQKDITPKKDPPNKNRKKTAFITYTPSFIVLSQKKSFFQQKIPKRDTRFFPFTGYTPFPEKRTPKKITPNTVFLG